MSRQTTDPVRPSPTPGASFVRLAWVADPIATWRRQGMVDMAEDRDAVVVVVISASLSGEISLGLGRRRDIGR